MLKTNNRSEATGGDLSNLRRLVYFAAVVETGSFTAAADRLGITKAVVSQQVARLEKEFRTALLIRTTRKVQTTEAGLAFYKRCVLILREAEDAFGELAETVQEPSGTLRLTAPFDYGIGVIVPAIATFNSRYPNCKVDAVLSDEKLDIMSGDIDLAIRVGWLTEQNLQARRIGGFRQILVASNELRTKINKLKNPHDILQLPFIANTALRNHSQWRFTLKNNEDQNVRVQPSIFLNATLAVMQAVREGAGISILPDYAVNEELAAGTLIHVLPRWNLPSGDIHAVFPTARFRPSKVKTFVDLLVHIESRRKDTADKEK
jgi:DNA-binding transcriptional LysR family regulator